MFPGLRIATEMSTLSRAQPYEGFPYRSPGPRAYDAPTLTPEEVAAMAEYNNLPRRVLRNDALVLGDGASGSRSESQRPRVPGQSQNQQQPNPSSSKEEDRPVVYIDMPTPGSSVVSGREETGPDFVQETIFYDPFKDRRIDTDSQTSTPNGPERPNHLDLGSPISSEPSPPNPNIPHFLSKETLIYNGNAHNLSPINGNHSVSPITNSPPSYEEASRADSRVQGLEENQEPPRTTVIVPGQTVVSIEHDNVVGLPLPDRKLLTCRFCGARGYTLVVKEVGYLNHVVSVVLLLFCLFVFIPIFYCTDCCKYTNHYCPTCNEKVAYELPCPCTSLRVI